LEYDLLLSVVIFLGLLACLAKHIKTHQKAAHASFCHPPLRFL
jgi:hypothetical protein